jgi:capsular polysaccharide biosynthesis protein
MGWSLARYVEILFRHWARFAVILFLLPTPVSIATLVYFRTYQAATDIWVESPTYFGSNTNVFAGGVSGWNQYLTPAQNETDQLNQYLQTTSFVYAVGDRMAADGMADAKLRNKLITSIAKTMHVTPNGSHLVTITFSCSKAAECTETLTATIAVFQDRLTEALKAQEQLSTSFLESQVTAAQQRRDTSEAALEKYLAEHPAPALGLSSGQTGIPQLDQLVTRAQQDRDQLTALQSQLGQAQYTFAAADQFVATSTKVVDAPGITAGGFLGDGSSLKRAVVVWLAAVGVAAVYLALLVWMDKTARDVRELVGRLSVPVLATVPMLSAKERF